ncbi:MAG: hypothetical protein GX786_09815 [Clostridiales bacterium]|nr:hypothetical protein [Clostridiales bacterium]
MRYHIDTIPLWDSMKLDSECLFCALRRKNELLEVERFLGASVMEPDSRIAVNQKGFCQSHQKMLFGEKNRLGLALLMHSHMIELDKKVHALLQQSAHAVSDGAEVSSVKRFLSGKNAESNKNLSAKAAELNAFTQHCILCESLEENMNRYTHTFFHLWQKDTGFKEAVKKSKGFCIPDTSKLLEVASKKLTGAALLEFVTIIKQLLEENLARLEKELEWFTLKFDYRNQDKPWENSKDALERTINKLRGWCVGEEPNPKDSTHR